MCIRILSTDNNNHNKIIILDKKLDIYNSDNY